MIKYIYILFTLFLFISCGSQTTSTNSNHTGYLVDAKVSGVQYECGNTKGITAIDGSFTFNYSCDDIVFKIGSITLASMKISNVPDDHIFYITDITQRSNRNDTNNTSVINIIRLLQTLDDDSNPDNGIQITKEIRNNITYNIPNDISLTNISENDLKNIIIDANLTKELVTPVRALVHFEQTLRDDNIYVDTVPPYKPYLDDTFLATSKDSIELNLYGERGTTIYLNGINTNKILDKNGKYTSFELNTSNIKNTFKDFNITLVDNSGKVSEVLNISIFKDTDDLGNKDQFTSASINMDSNNTLIYDINITDNSTDYNLSLVYNIEGNNSELFDINNTNGILYFKSNPISGKTYNLNISVSDLAGHTMNRDINITVN